MKSLRRIQGCCCALAWLIGAFLLLIWAHSAQAQLPNVISFEPTKGKPGTSVKITGTGFSTAKTVTFNGVQGIFFNDGDTIIYVTVPEDAISGPIVVNNATGPDASSGQFIVSPRISTLTPDRALAGRTIVINGYNFLTATNVSFGGISASFSITSDTQISATVPTGATNAPVKVITVVGTAVTTNDFLVTAAPVIKDFNPTVATVGQTVVINGGDFTGVTNVLFNGTAAINYTFTSPSQIHAVIPTGATVGPIKVQTPGGEAVSATNLITGAGPIISSFSPIAGPVGKRITLNGSGFTGLNRVHFNDTETFSGGVTADTLAFADVPSGATTGPIKVTKGTNVFITSSNFIVGSFPVITDFSPKVGTPNFTAVVITGDNFVPGTTVKFGGVAAANVTRTSDTQLHATVPSGATNAPIYVITSTHTNVSSEVFIVNGAAPTVVDFTPKAGAPGTIVTLYGYGFSGASSVKLNGQSVSFTVTSVSGTNQISATLPSDATTGTFSVTTSGGTGTSTNSFYVWPRITSFGPVEAAALSSLTLTGLNFTATMEVRVGEVTVPSQFVSVPDNTRISFFVPDTCVSAPITIKTPAGLLTTITNFGMLPKVDTLVPDRGRAGDTVVIQGSGLFNVNHVRFNGVSASFTNDSVNRITATVPAGVTSGPIQVVTDEGTTNSTASFLVFPTVTDFAPKNGPIGTVVLLDGLNFLEVTNLTLSSVNMSFTIDSATRIRATIPSAFSGNMKLYNPAGITDVAEVFTIRPLIQTTVTVDGDLVIEWPVDAPTFQLQSTPSLVAPIVWTDDPAAVNTVGNIRRAIITPPSSGNRFFRLVFEFPE